MAETVAQFKEERQFWAESECRILCDTPLALVLQYNDPEFDRLEICVYLHEKQHANVISHTQDFRRYLYIVLPILTYSF